MKKRLYMKIDVSGFVEAEDPDGAWKAVDFPPNADIVDSWYGVEVGSSGPCQHAVDEPHREGEWCGAWVDFDLETPEDCTPLSNAIQRQDRVMSTEWSGIDPDDDVWPGIDPDDACWPA